MKLFCKIALLIGLAYSPVPAWAQTAAPADAEVYLISPRDGAKLRSPIAVRFGLRNMGVTHAGDASPNMGHHHLLIDVSEPIDPTEPLPANKKYLHFGAGQTETKLELPPGNHTLQLVLGDANHRPFKPLIASKIIHIRVLRSKSVAAL